MTHNGHVCYVTHQAAVRLNSYNIWKLIDKKYKKQYKGDATLFLK